MPSSYDGGGSRDVFSSDMVAVWLLQGTYNRQGLSDVESTPHFKLRQTLMTFESLGSRLSRFTF